MGNPRHVIWFSCGAASAVMTKRVLVHYPDALVVYCDTGSEHPDNKRFLAECEGWFGQEVIVLKSDKYDNHFDVIEKTRYVNGVAGARCTKELKIKQRLKFQQDDDVQYIGYTVEEEKRAKQFCKSFPDVDVEFPLIDCGLTKEQCIGLLLREGISIPIMYELGYNNNNCIGCVKGGMGYWNKIRRDFPDKFKRMAELERGVGRACLGKGKFLDELDPEAGRHTDITIQCDFMCHLSEVFG